MKTLLSLFISLSRSLLLPFLLSLSPSFFVPDSKAGVIRFANLIGSRSAPGYGEFYYGRTNEKHDDGTKILLLASARTPMEATGLPPREKSRGFRARPFDSVVALLSIIEV